MKNFTLKYSEKNYFLIYFFVLNLKNAVFHNFLCFPFCAKFLCFPYRGKLATLIESMLMIVASIILKHWEDVLVELDVQKKTSIMLWFDTLD